MKIGLRVDVDTFRGTRLGVPTICRLLEKYSRKASFFFSVGPDNMGRHLWRLLRPTFLMKMLRTKASSLYGWDILLKGTLWPGPLIGKRLGDIIRATADAGHEIGLHAWDHHAWQAHIDSMDSEAIYDSLNKGVTLLTQILGCPPDCSAVPGWKSNDLVLKEKSKFPFRYNSDCRGDSIFYPIVDGQKLLQPQVPVTLPTYDEVVGRNGITDDNYNDYLLSSMTPDRLNVLTIHAEVEGIVCEKLFDDFLCHAHTKGILFVPLGSLLAYYPPVKRAEIIAQEIPGRQGWVCCQSNLSCLSKKDRTL
ncbi:MAG: 4-deoxy-4-formamido-L-arabinose-phosphoundecaprenol deformylase [Deltaproteobacteria bacterium RBG_13_47_9]|nr:MAG: 4-deoxy-4-formamido-L-arabinose-phosphoundecaprenol deformylase [Deltaproteobacteria bacterium RBG_13_47_9]